MYEIVEDFDDMLEKNLLLPWAHEIGRKRLQLLGHLCLLMRFNELETYVWTYVVLTLICQDKNVTSSINAIRFLTLTELLISGALFTKIALSSKNVSRSVDMLDESGSECAEETLYDFILMS